MTGWTREIFAGVTQTRSFFTDDIGNRRTGYGTGFWVQHAERVFLVTNRHNVDPKLAVGNETALVLSRLDVRMRMLTDGEYMETTQFCSFPDTTFSFHETADVAIVEWTGRRPLGVFGFSAMPFDHLADADFIVAKVEPMDSVAFIGYPGGDKGEQWWDTRTNFPIARSATIASLVHFPFQNPRIATSHAALVNGLSFKGSSGSPVLSFRKGLEWKIAEDHSAQLTTAIDARCIGIMAGHLREGNALERFDHSALSYFVVSIAIRELLELATA